MRLRLLGILAIAVLLAPLLLVGAAWAGHLTVNIQPTEATRAGAAWSVDFGQKWYQSGETVELTTGRYVVNFKALDGWKAPEDYNLDMEERVRSTIKAEYVRMVVGAELKVTIAPPEVAELGEVWSVDNGTTWHPSGAGVALDAGKYTLTFKPQSGWITPPSMDVSLDDGDSMEINSTYGSIISGDSGVLRVILRPATAVKAGARWSVDGGHTWFMHKVGLRLEPGEYRVSFKALEGYRTPAPRKVVITKGQETMEYGKYIK